MHQYQETPSKKTESGKPSRLETVSKENFSEILQSIALRIKMIKQQSKTIQENLEVKKLQIENSKPSQITIHNSQNYHLLKSLVQSAYNHNGNQQAEQFEKENGRVQQDVNRKMKEVSAAQNAIISLMEAEEGIITEIEKSEVALKSILKSKGSLSEAEKKQSQRKSLIAKLRSLRESLSKLKEEEIGTIRAVISSYNKMFDLRKRRVDQIEHFQGVKLESCMELLNTFIVNLSTLIRMKVNLRKSNEQEGISNMRRTAQANQYTSSKRANDFVRPFTLTEKNQNSITTKSSEIFRQMTHEKSQPFSRSFSLQDIILQYQNICQKISDLKEMEKLYFRNKIKAAEDQSKIMAFQKVYLIGILGWQPEESLQTYERVISEAVDRVRQYVSKLQEDVKEKNSIKISLQNIEQVITVYEQKIEETLKQEARKKALAAQIQSLMSQFRNNSKKAEATKEIYKQIEQKKLQLSLMEKEQQEFAELGDLENYRKNSYQIEIAEKAIRDLERNYFNYSSDPNNQRPNNQTTLSKIQAAVCKSNLNFDFHRIKEGRQNPSQVVQRIYKRLLPI